MVYYSYIKVFNEYYYMLTQAKGGKHGQAKH